MHPIVLFFYCIAAVPCFCILFGIALGIFDEDIPDITHSDTDPEM